MASTYTQPVQLLIDEYGFPPMIRLLQAFDRGLDVDQAFEEVYGTSPDEIRPRCGWGQRIRASAPTSSPLSASTIGW